MSSARSHRHDVAALVSRGLRRGRPLLREAGPNGATRRLFERAVSTAWARRSAAPSLMPEGARFKTPITHVGFFSEPGWRVRATDTTCQRQIAKRPSERGQVPGRIRPVASYC